MVAWSCFASRTVSKRNLALKALSALKNELVPGHSIQNAVNLTLVRGHNTITIQPSRFKFDKFKDMLNFYLLLAVIPFVLISGYCHIFIGPATLALIPEGYEPKPWEYHKNPITRFFAKHITMSPQEVHERNLHNIFYQGERLLIRQLELKIERLMKERLDYQAYYTSPRPATYGRLLRDLSDEAEENIMQSHGLVK